jgi:hypothetical protein
LLGSTIPLTLLLLTLLPVAFGILLLLLLLLLVATVLQLEQRSEAVVELGHLLVMGEATLKEGDGK